jgi:hypothetical protein
VLRTSFLEKPPADCSSNVEGGGSIVTNKSLDFQALLFISCLKQQGILVRHPPGLMLAGECWPVDYGTSGGGLTCNGNIMVKNKSQQSAVGLGQFVTVMVQWPELTLGA